MNSQTKTSPAGDEPEAYPTRWLALVVMMAANFMNLLDVTIVNVALPSLQGDLGADSSQIEWVVAGYVLVFALGLLPFGRWGDVKGKKHALLLGISFFTLASALCGIAANIEILVLSRFIQGAAAALMTPQVLAIAQVMFPPKERAAAFSLFGLSAGLASVSGPIIGGWLIGMNFFDLGWRPIFLINIPIGIMAVILGTRLIPAIPAKPGQRNDFVGIAIAASGIFCIIFPLVEGRGFGWPAWCFVMVAAALPLFFAFYQWECRQNARGGPELLPVSLMRNSTYVVGALMTAIFFSSLPGFFLIFAMFLQSGFGLTPLQSGLTTMPFSVGVFFASIISGRIGNIAPRTRIAIGVVMVFVGMLALRFVVQDFSDSIERTHMLPFLLLAGLGLGIAIAPMFQLVLAGVPPHDAGSGSGALQAIQQMGSVFGIAIVSQIFFSHLEGALGSGIAQHAAYIDSFSLGLIYNFAAYTLVLIAVLLLKQKHPVDAVAVPVVHD